MLGVEYGWQVIALFMFSGITLGGTWSTYQGGAAKWVTALLAIIGAASFGLAVLVMIGVLK